MKMFGKTTEKNANGYKSKIYFFWIPIIKKIREQGNRRLYFFGVKFYHKNFPMPQIINNQTIQTIYDDSSRYVTEILNKALEKNLREMKQFEKEAKERLAKIEKKLK